MVEIKRIHRKRHYYRAKILKSGKIKILGRWKHTAETKIKIRLSIIAKLPPEKRPTFLKSSIRQLKGYKKIEKKNIIDRTKLTNVEEIVTKNPIIRKRAIMQITFGFQKAVKNRIIETKRTARSNKLPLSERITAFNQCYQRALAQIDFSPDKVIIISKSFIYYERIKK